jgi:hypothetical protein
VPAWPRRVNGGVRGASTGGLPGARRTGATRSRRRRRTRLASLLPRLTTAEGRCWECENEFHRHECPQVVRHIEFPARTVADALVLVASVASYKRPADTSRLAPSRAGELVSDWVGAFAISLGARLGPKTVPTHLMVDPHA